MSKRIQSDYKQKQCPIVETVQDDGIRVFSYKFKVIIKKFIAFRYI